MNIIYLDKFEEHVTKQLDLCYIFLGSDCFLLKKNQDMIIKIANQQGFSNSIYIDIVKNEDWTKVLNIYKIRNLFCIKTIIIVNWITKTLNQTLNHNINIIQQLLNTEILIILKLNHLSSIFEKNKIFTCLKNNTSIISCATPYNEQFINWIKYEINKKNINLEKQAFALLCKYYEGNTLFIYNILNIFSIQYPNTCITTEQTTKVISNFFNFIPLHWINAIFQKHTKIAVDILHHFYKKHYNPLILIRSLQKDLLILIHAKHENITNLSIFFKKNNIKGTRYKFFYTALKNNSYANFLQAIKILLKIEINIKKEYSKAIWFQLYELTLKLSSI